MRVDHIRCPACSRNIREFADDLVLTKLDGTERRFYHTHCSHAAERILFEEGRAIWRLTYRPALEDEDGVRGAA